MWPHYPTVIAFYCELGRGQLEDRGCFIHHLHGDKIRFSSISPEAGGLDLEVMAGGAEQLLRHKTWV